MTLLWMDGFDLLDYSRRNYAGGVVNATSSTTRFSYGQCIESRGFSNDPTLKKNITASAVVYTGAAINYGTHSFMFCSDSGATLHITVNINTDGSCSVIRNGTTIASGGAGTVPGAGSPTQSSWNYVEVKCKVDSSTGEVKIRANGQTSDALSFTGNTRNGGTSANIDQVIIASGLSNDGGWWDDWYIINDQGSTNNTWLGDVRVYTLSPSGAGSSTQWTPSSGSNYTDVDEQPYNTSDYVSDSVSGHRDTYAMTDLPGSVATVYGVQNVAIANKDNTGVISVKQALKSGSSVYYGSNTLMTTTYTTYTDLREQDPNTSAAWTASGVNAAEAGVEIV